MQETCRAAIRPPPDHCATPLAMRPFAAIGIVAAIPLVLYPMLSRGPSCVFTVSRSGETSARVLYLENRDVQTQTWYSQPSLARAAVPSVYEVLGRQPQDQLLLHRLGMTRDRSHWLLLGSAPLAEAPAGAHAGPPSSGWRCLPGQCDSIAAHCSGAWWGGAAAARSRGRSGDGWSSWSACPATLLLLLLNGGAAVLLRVRRVAPERVWLSYDAAVRRGEFWRVFTASFAHFDPLHLVLNLGALASFKPLEQTFGSLTFLALSVGLAALTAAAVLLGARVTGRDRPAVGFSCVLFALITFVATGEREYCPLPFLPRLCFATFRLPLPGGAALPLNLAPLALLLLTHFAMPRASLEGHLAGIAMGYPLAWGILDLPLSPPVVAAAAAAAAALLRAPDAPRLAGGLRAPCALLGLAAALLYLFVGFACLQVLSLPTAVAAVVVAAAVTVAGRAMPPGGAVDAPALYALLAALAVFAAGEALGGLAAFAFAPLLRQSGIDEESAITAAALRATMVLAALEALRATVTVALELRGGEAALRAIGVKVPPQRVRAFDGAGRRLGAAAAPSQEEGKALLRHADV